MSLQDDRISNKYLIFVSLDEFRLRPPPAHSPNKEPHEGAHYEVILDCFDLSSPNT